MSPSRGAVGEANGERLTQAGDFGAGWSHGTAWANRTGLARRRVCCVVNGFLVDSPHIDTCTFFHDGTI